jgi:hypothetical protein
MIFPEHVRGKHFRSHLAVLQLLFVNDVRRFLAGLAAAGGSPERTLFGRSPGPRPWRGRGRRSAGDRQMISG